jgi:hypothetical protein
MHSLAVLGPIILSIIKLSCIYVCNNAESYYAGCRGTLNIALPNAIMVSVIMLKVIKQSVFKPRNIMLNVKAC